MKKSIYGGKMTRSEAKANFVTRSHNEALDEAADLRSRGFRAHVEVVKTRYGKARVWGVFYSS